MTTINKTVLVGHSANQMFELVDRVEDYPKFLPWCGGSTVAHQDGGVTHATILINYHFIRHSFTTINTRKSLELIEMTLLNGPFKHLDGHWHFISLGDTSCKIEFSLNYTFSNKLLEKIVGPVFFIIANNFVEAFVARAEKIYMSS